MSLIFTACFIYFIFLAVVFAGIRRYRQKPESPDKSALPSVSIVIAAHDEAAHLAELIPGLSGICYPNELLQIIVVDDRSADDTAVILKELRQKHTFEHLHIEDVSPRYSPKKFALAKGIQAAKHEVILVTDADCRPGSKWVDQVSAVFHVDCVAVIGFSPVISRSESLSKILAIDSLAVATLGLAGAGWRKPFLTTGRNFAYRKSAFAQAGGFTGFEHELSGDDDLLLQRLAPLGEVEFALSASAHVVSLGGPENMRAWLRQKRRHISASKKYPLSVQLSYLIFHLCNAIIWLSPFWLGMIGLLLLAAKIGADFLILRSTAARLSWQPRWRYLPRWELLYVIMHTFAGPSAFLGKIRWKT